MEKLRQNCDENAEFIQNFKSGDVSAFNKFCLTHRCFAVSAIKGRCKPNEVEDLVQEAFMKAFKARNSYDPEKSKLSTWLSRIALSIAIDQYRRNKARVKVCQTEEIEKSSTEIVSRTEIYTFIYRRLSEEDANLVRLRFVEDMRYEDIAAALDMQIGTVKSTLCRLRKKMIEWSKDAR
jgi:RNA polymerase sigma-70 factor (ECF subfamily)